MGWAKALWAREMGHDCFFQTEHGLMYKARFPAGCAKVAFQFYGVYDAKHCYRGCSGNGESICIERRDLEDIKFRYRAFQSVIWDFDEFDAKLAVQIGESVQAIENYFANTPPSLADETYFLIKQLAVPEGIAKRIAAYASTDTARVTVDFR